MARRTHTKSRRGCANCKRRRVKCDEHKPKCQNCITRDIACTYAPPKPFVWVNEESSSPTNGELQRTNSSPQTNISSSTRTNNGTLPPPPPPSSPQTLNLENIDLIIYWFTQTVHTVNPTSNPALLEICQTTILKQAMSHPFLLHGLLALSALHLADNHHDAEKYIQIGTAHHTQGLALYHSILSDINDSNYAASIAFSSITIMFAFGLSRPQAQGSGNAGMEIIDHLVQIFMLTKGWHRVVDVAEGLKIGESPIMTPVEPSVASLSPETEKAFDRLVALNQAQIDGDKKQKETYTLAISTLKSCFRTLAAEGGNENPHVALEWANTLPEDFIRLVRERKELALVVVGFYCVILHTVPQVWWIRGWSRVLFGVVWRNVSAEGKDVLEWSRGEIGVEV